MLLNINRRTTKGKESSKSGVRAGKKWGADDYLATSADITRSKTDIVYSSVRDSVRGMLTTKGTRSPHIKIPRNDRARIACSSGEKKERAGECLPEVLKTAHGYLGSCGDDPQCCSHSWEIQSV